MAILLSRNPVHSECEVLGLFSWEHTNGELYFRGLWLLVSVIFFGLVSSGGEGFWGKGCGYIPACW